MRSFTCTWFGGEANERYCLRLNPASTTVNDISKEEGKGLWEGISLGFKAAKVNVRIIVNDANKIVKLRC
jgi:hypothetical protein